MSAESAQSLPEAEAGEGLAPDAEASQDEEAPPTGGDASPPNGGAPAPEAPAGTGLTPPTLTGAAGASSPT
jgi:hypothetical protein